MKYVFDNYVLNLNKIINYGFNKKNNIYFLKYPTINDFYFLIEINLNQEINIDCFDQSTDEEYELFNIQISTGSLVNQLREIADNLILEIRNVCYEENDLKERISEYIFKKYQLYPAYPFKEDNETLVLKTKKGKWFGIIMHITYKQLGINHKGTLNILNIKLPEQKVLSLIDNQKFFKAYHMNKKYWISIALNNEIDTNYLYELIDESYCLVNI